MSPPGAAPSLAPASSNVEIDRFAGGLSHFVCRTYRVRKEVRCLGFVRTASSIPRPCGQRCKRLRLRYTNPEKFSLLGGPDAAERLVCGGSIVRSSTRMCTPCSTSIPPHVAAPSASRVRQHRETAANGSDLERGSPRYQSSSDYDGRLPRDLCREATVFGSCAGGRADLERGL